MSRGDVTARGAASARHGSRAERVSGDALVDRGLEREFSEILSHRERVSDGSASDHGPSGQATRSAAEGREAAAPPSLFLRGGAAHAAQRPDPVAMTEPVATQASPGAHGAAPAASPVAGVEPGAPVPLMPEAIVETLIGGWAKHRLDAGGARRWTVQVLTSGAGLAELEIELAADGSWHARVRDDDASRPSEEHEGLDARFAGIAGDAGQFCVELERRLGQSRPELRFSAREA